MAFLPDQAVLFEVSVVVKRWLDRVIAICLAMAAAIPILVLLGIVGVFVYQSWRFF
jgi:ABC-type phosphate transport system permease subunit